jgi:uncharacterized membrane protein YfcA
LAFVGLIIGFRSWWRVLIIPALLFFANLPMQAVGTSLFIIFINSLIGFGGDLIGGVELNYKLLFIISAMALLGCLSELKYPKKLMAKLKPAFGWFVLIMGIYIIVTELFFTKFYVTYATEYID